MNSYYVYILKCADGSYYIGITNNLDQRLTYHQLGKNINCYTYRRRPLEMKFYQVFNDVLQAIYFEKKLKKWTRAKKEALINGDFDMLQILAECRNATHYKYNSRWALRLRSV
ncbi:GIY-YIG nuclease family protein [Seonamhaeicola sp.]|uniref:GIY-YIG nuclease family protein n=1 Tax=Seonamhaeicola sp. TaxID=1912245 RepID=UPI0026364469|nr:GIY-YIG nuclease family protein [Seonamhaeicola sp.]